VRATTRTGLLTCKCARGGLLATSLVRALPTNRPPIRLSFTARARV